MSAAEERGPAVSLRQAAQQALEALEWAWGGEPLTGKEMVAITALKQALAEPEQDPVGWQWLNTCNYRKKLPANAIPEHWRPLYTAPTPRKPLTDEEMRECAQAMNAEPLAEGWPELIKFARAIERAHGIGGGE